MLVDRAVVVWKVAEEDQLDPKQTDLTERVGKAGREETLEQSAR
jgi:hypothetical protein